MLYERPLRNWKTTYRASAGVHVCGSVQSLGSMHMWETWWFINHTGDCTFILINGPRHVVDCINTFYLATQDLPVPKDPAQIFLIYTRDKPFTRDAPAKPSRSFSIRQGDIAQLFPYITAGLFLGVTSLASDL